MTLYYNENIYLNPKTGGRIVQTHIIALSNDYDMTKLVIEENIELSDEGGLSVFNTKLKLRQEVRTWLNTNIGRNQWRYIAFGWDNDEYDPTFFFFKKEQAMKFKLAWS